MSCLSSSKPSVSSLLCDIPSLQQCIKQSDEKLLSQICVRHFALRDSSGRAPGGKLQVKKVEKYVRGFVHDVVCGSKDFICQPPTNELVHEVCMGNQNFDSGEVVLLPYLAFETANSPLDIVVSARADIAFTAGNLSSPSIQYSPYKFINSFNYLSMRTWIASDCEIYERYLGLAQFLWDCFVKHSWKGHTPAVINAQKKASVPLTSLEFKLDYACAQTISHSLQVSLESINVKRQAAVRKQFEEWIDINTHPHKRVRDKETSELVGNFHKGNLEG